MAKERNEIDAWLDRADEKLDAAELLVVEQYFNDAVSIAYYAIFSAAKAALASIGIETKSHAGLRNQFGQHFVQTGLLDAQLVRILTSVFEVRLNSDYSISSFPSQLEAETVLKEAQQFVTTIKKFLSETNDF